MSTSTRNAHPSTLTENDPRWAAVVARDPEANFYYFVNTTGVNGRPSCAARHASLRTCSFTGLAKMLKRPGSVHANDASLTRRRLPISMQRRLLPPAA